MQIPGESIGIIADDLTGACDTALQFYLEGADTRILLDYTAASPAGGNQTLLVDTESRHLEQFDAIASVRKSVHFLRETAKLDRFYKKIDSTLRGHVAQECLAILDELRWKAAVIAPAYADEGRRTVGGYQIVRGLPVGQTEIARDPLFPVRESHIPTLLGQTADPAIVGYVPLSKVMDGAGPIKMALLEQISENKKLIVVDACSDTDLEQLSLAINKMPSDVNVLPCGSAGLAKALSRKWILHRERAPRPHMVINRSPLLMVIGTASKVTRDQVNALMDNFSDYAPDETLRVFYFTPLQILGLAPVDEEIQEIIQVLKTNATVIITTSLSEHNYEKTVVMAEEQNITPTQASAKAVELLAHVTNEVMNVVNAKLLLSGGDTASTVCKKIGVRSLQIVEQVDTSIPLMIDQQARWIVTKSGGFGNYLSLLTIFRNLKGLESQEEVLYD